MSGSSDLLVRLRRGCRGRQLFSASLYDQATCTCVICEAANNIERLRESLRVIVENGYINPRDFWDSDAELDELLGKEVP